MASLASSSLTPRSPLWLRLACLCCWHVWAIALTLSSILRRASQAIKSSGVHFVCFHQQVAFISLFCSFVLFRVVLLANHFVSLLRTGVIDTVRDAGRVWRSWRFHRRPRMGPWKMYAEHSWPAMKEIGRAHV